MSAITRMYDLLRGMPIPELEKIAYVLRPESELVFGDAEDPNAALRLKLQDLDRAVAALKTAPAQEGQAELVQFIESLMPLAAYALSPENEDALLQKTAAETLHPLFKEFEEIYANQYSDRAIEELRKNGKSISEEELEQGQEYLEKLNSICAVNLEKANEEEYLRCVTEMQQFLAKLNAQTHPALFNPLLQELHKYRRENMGNFERFLDNFHKTSLKTIRNQSMHADYLQGWERVGYMTCNLVHAITDTVAHGLTGRKVPFVETDDNTATANDFITVNGVPRRKPM